MHDIGITGQALVNLARKNLSESKDPTIESRGLSQQDWTTTCSKETILLNQKTLPSVIEEKSDEDKGLLQGPKVLKSSKCWLHKGQVS